MLQTLSQKRIYTRRWSFTLAVLERQGSRPVSTLSKCMRHRISSAPSRMLSQQARQCRLPSAGGRCLRLPLGRPVILGPVPTPQQKPLPYTGFKAVPQARALGLRCEAPGLRALCLGKALRLPQELWWAPQLLFLLQQGRLRTAAAIQGFRLRKLNFRPAKGLSLAQASRCYGKFFLVAREANGGRGAGASASQASMLQYL